jgi:hypothetical protein
MIRARRGNASELSCGLRYKFKFAYGKTSGLMGVFLERQNPATIAGQTARKLKRQ